eukprot:COSAG01_NODE_5585_length_4163_cov_1.897146_5_plen_59_part_00
MDGREECLDQSSQHQTGRMMQPFLVGTHRYTQAGADLPPEVAATDGHKALSLPSYHIP